jgi:hypothetical protein
MLPAPDYQEILQLQRDLADLRTKWRRLIRDYYMRKCNPLQPRKPAGPGGGQWMSDGNGSAVPSKT